MPGTESRIVGSGYTVMSYRGAPIAYLDDFNDSGQVAVGGRSGNGMEVVTPIDNRHPLHPNIIVAKEIATSRVLGPGTIQATVRELWNAPVWHRLFGLAGTNNIVEVWEAFSRDSTADVTMSMLIRPPTGNPRGKTFHNCLVSAIPDGEQVDIGALTVAKTIIVTYLYTTPL